MTRVMSHDKIKSGYEQYGKTYLFITTNWPDWQGDQMFSLKNRPKTIKNRPKSRPNIFLLVFLYKTILWCFLFDFMLTSNGTGHSFIVFLHKKGD